MIQVDDSNYKDEVAGRSEPTVAYFTAPWCGPCRVMGPTVEALAEEYEDRVRFAKVDVDLSPKTTDQLGIRSVPTLLFYSGGEIAKTLVGAQSRASIERALAGLSAGDI